MQKITTLNLPDFHRSVLGFDRLMNDYTRLDNSGYPPYNVETIGEEKYQITLALAGFNRDDLEITVKEGTLTVTGNKPEEDEERTYLHRGIATRAFSREWKLAEYVEVVEATMEDGMLYVLLERQIPEEKLPKTIAIR
jgi:molecular chaperone IbpA|tara:strand:- start:6832 stop:7245 length:414 start_codon:yes stop_codon:yes gene_type:complete